MAKANTNKVAKSTNTNTVEAIVSEKQEKKRTYSCSICGEEGHQSRKCDHDFISKLPTEAEQYSQILADLKASNYTESVTAFLHAAWGVHEQLQARSKTRQTGKGPRVCSECGEAGHNAATCKRDRPQREYVKARQAIVRARILGAPDALEASRFLAQAVADKLAPMDTVLDMMRDRDQLSPADLAAAQASLPGLEKDLEKKTVAFKKWEARMAKLKENKASKKSKG